MRVIKTKDYDINVYKEPRKGTKTGKAGRPPIDRQLAQKLRAQGYSYGKIAKEMHCSKSSVWRAINK